MSDTLAYLGLTAILPACNNGSVRRSGGLFVFALAAAVGAASVAECLPWESMTPSQMACCAAVDHDCRAAGMDKICCPTGDRDTNQAPVSTFVKVQSAPVVTEGPAAWALPTSGASSLIAAFEAFGREILKLPERPTYLLVSTFLI